ncbi:PEP-CTERM sorting domain-containing protein [Cerasicoccus arenae]|uniref:Ice-binding protein C-terminal domain-containing protein n=1 Tax=Cerasicoccus arenae TaxID=424488 RepID=A0A8J3GD31_9BACT|nr:PEP-CTERM sorting domain-containing protein [Cerasicoccus arenae]MBK1859342.1 PEP-CTERM sorting domain-containing protein [Cerasicoccus arenae]GHB93832.1 hypothetical protein GCM10007047_06730 [Cerasicoccus arenae]
MKRILLLLGLISIVNLSHASVHYNISETLTGVQVDFSGSIDYNGTGWTFDGNAFPVSRIAVTPQLLESNTGDVLNRYLHTTTIVTPVASNVFSLESPGTITGVPFTVGNGFVTVPTDYVSGDNSLVGSFFIAGQTFDDLGITPAVGATFIDYGTDLITFTATAIPEPSTYAALFGLAILGLVMVRKRS